MESMFSKLKSTVTKVTADVTSAVSVVLGNPVTREYEITGHAASGGPNLAWKIYHGFKKSTKQDVAVFVFEKKQLERFGRLDRDPVLEQMRRGVQQLTRLRHPRLLTVEHSLEESRDCLAFCTEPVFASLANILGKYDNLPSPVPADICEHELYDVETKYGLLQLAEGLSFLHNSVRMVHGNLTPENVILNKNGAWKIMGFDFFITVPSNDDNVTTFPCSEWDPALPPLCHPRPEYLAPEYILSVSCETASDMYSFGMLMYAVFNKGKTILEPSVGRDIFKSFSIHLDKLSRLSPSVLRNVPEGVRDHLKMLLNVAPTVRPDADQLGKIPYFEDVGAATLQYLDTLFQRDNLQKSQFFKGLPKVLPQLPKRVVQQRVLPCLVTEFVNPNMVPFVLPNVLLISVDCSRAEYTDLVLPDLIPIFKLQEPIQVLLIFLQKMDLLLTKTPAEDIKQHILPMIFRALEAPSIQIQELCLNIIPTFASLIESSSMKNSLFPRIKNACLQTSSLAVRVNALVCMGKLLQHLDKWFVLDEVLPFLQLIPSKEPAVLMAILGIYKCTFSHKKLGITKEILAGKVLPHLVPLSIESSLNLNQFNSYIVIIKEMVSRIEMEQRGKLEQLQAMHNEHTNLDLHPQLSIQSEAEQTAGGSNKTDDIFKTFGLDPSAKATRQANSEHKENGVSTHSSKPQVSLTLDEKQKLAKQQEQAQMLRSQKHLLPQSKAHAISIPQPKNLAANLLDDFMKPGASLTPGGLSAPGTFSSGSCRVNSAIGTPSTGTRFATPALSTGNGFAPLSFNGVLPMPAGMPPQIMVGNPVGYGPVSGGPPKPSNMMPLDNLFGPQKAKVTLNQLAQPHTPAPMQGGTWSQAFIPAANQALGQGNPFLGNPPTQPNPISRSNSTTPVSASSDLQDLLG
uniref:SCY1-like protein 2 n=1 Tax=Myxine glutinosa TaxID=7769 RepID=UPI00358F0628